MIRVVVAEKVGLLRGALCAVLSDQAEMEAVAAVPDVADLPAVARRAEADVVVLDLVGEMPQALKALARIGAELPEVAVLALGDRWKPALLRTAMAAGVRGFASTDRPPGDLVRMVRRLAAGERVIDPGVAVAVLGPQPGPLTTRELEVLRAAAEGLPLKEIAGQLFLAYGTVRNYLSMIQRKTGTRNRLEAVRQAQLAGWL